MVVIRSAPQHQFQILTKRVERLAEYAWPPKLPVDAEATEIWLHSDVTVRVWKTPVGMETLASERPSSGAAAAEQMCNCL